MGLLSGLTGGGGGSKTGFAFPPESEEVKKAREDLYNLSQDGTPNIPLQGIAPLEPMTDEQKRARSTAMDMSNPIDIFSMPEVQAIIQQITAKGDLMANRLGRSMQTTGNKSSTSGRDVLGRSVSDVQGTMTSALAPFASQERNRRMGLIPMLEQLGLSENMRKEGYNQNVLNAGYNKDMTETMFPYEQIAPILESIISNQPSAVPTVSGTAGGGGGLGGLGGMIGPLLTSIMTPDNMAMAGAKIFAMCVPESFVIDCPDGQKLVQDIRAGDMVFDKDFQPAVVWFKYEFSEVPTTDRFIELTFEADTKVTVCDLHKIDGIRAKDLKIGENGLVSKKFVPMDVRSYDIMTSGRDGSYLSNGIGIDSMIPELHTKINQKIQEN